MRLCGRPGFINGFGAFSSCRDSLLLFRFDLVMQAAENGKDGLVQILLGLEMRSGDALEASVEVVHR